jgi:hypothetical protein
MPHVFADRATGGDGGVGGQKGKRVDSKWSLSYSEGWHRPYFSRRIGLLSCTRIGSPLHACIEWGYPPSAHSDRTAYVQSLRAASSMATGTFSSYGAASAIFEAKSIQLLIPRAIMRISYSALTIIALAISVALGILPQTVRSSMSTHSCVLNSLGSVDCWGRYVYIIHTIFYASFSNMKSYDESCNCCLCHSFTCYMYSIHTHHILFTS